MFDKTKLKILKKLLEIAYPEQELELQKIGNQYVIFNNDLVGCRDYLLKGKYTYDQVVELNKMTGYCAGFGFCKELGPVAFIGIPTKNYAQNGYFEYEIQEYGQPINMDEYYFEAYTEEEAKQIGNYTVYGMGDPRKLENQAPIEKVDHFKDYRYIIRDEFNEDAFKNLGALEMQIKLGGTYNFYEARLFAYGSTGKFQGSSGEDVPIQFAIVNETKPVGILGLWKHHDDMMFKDVWELGKEKPEKEIIRFLSDEEAEKIDNFELYYFIPTHSFGKKQYVTEKIDRTLNVNFNFTMEDGTDYRLQKIEKEKTKKLVK